MDLTVVPVKKPENSNLILGQSHFIKTVETCTDPGRNRSGHSLRPGFL